MPELIEAPRMLIGLDNAELIASRDIRKTSTNGPLLQRTLLGWTVTGKIVLTEQSIDPEVNFLNTKRDDTNDLWSTDDFGCKYNDNRPHSLED